MQATSYPAPLLASASARSTNRMEMERIAKVQKGEEDILELCCHPRAPRVTEEQENNRIPVQKVRGMKEKIDTFSDRC